eukprot:TRINITY_DN3057_c0_g4_i1.p3 TRINITY_DN3057_c0_g4~~TRINITY_DN3057_c0_g4_i1.p3  ORF type:complete len:105 (-),score=0.92 TRINITY_DN3057_c0_g4_i1:314-628(-)
MHLSAGQLSLSKTKKELYRCPATLAFITLVMQLTAILIIYQLKIFRRGEDCQLNYHMLEVWQYYYFLLVMEFFLQLDKVYQGELAMLGTQVSLQLQVCCLSLVL